MPHPAICKWILRSAWLLSLMLSGLTGAVGSASPVSARSSGEGSAKPNSYPVALFGKKYNLDDNKSLLAYIQALDTEIERSKKEEPLGEAHEKDPLHNKEPKNFVNKKMRRAMEETRSVARKLSSAEGNERDLLRKDLAIMAGAIHASYKRVLPNDMDIFTALAKMGRLKRPPISLGKAGIATNLAGDAADPAQCDPVLPSSYWTKPTDMATKDLYYGFGRDALPTLDEVVCTYRQSKQGRGKASGFEVKCDKYGKVKLKFGEEFSQPVAHRLFWALGFNTTPVDCVPTVKVKWDRRIFTEFNTRKQETLAVRFLGIAVHVYRLQRYRDPLQPVSEVIMRDEQGKEISMKPNPDWEAFKKQLYKNPKGRPETIENNFNDAFADRIQYLVYRNVNFQQKEDEDEDEPKKKEIDLGNWDWNSDGNPGMRENRAFVFVSAWLNQFDSWVQNNELTMTKQDGRRIFKHYVTDLGGCLGPASNTDKMRECVPNQFPWTFTRPARPGEVSIPLDGSFRNIQENETFKAADIYDARWIAPYLAQLTGKQILEALVASRMPSAMVRVFYNKLIHRRNKALTDLGLAYPPIPPMDASQEFDYDPQKDGLLSIITSRNETATAPDGDLVVVKGRVYTRAEVSSGKAARDIARNAR